MPKARASLLDKPIRTYNVRAMLIPGNGATETATRADRIGRLEETIQEMQTALAVQFQRIADMQILIDRLTARNSRAPFAPKAFR